MKSLMITSSQKIEIFLVSACLIGMKTRYDGCLKPSDNCIKELRQTIWIPVCPEQLGGLPTPRAPADIVGGDGHDVLAGRAKVITRDGRDVTENFLAGAGQVLTVAKAQQISGVYLKARSPSCGLIPVIGVTAALLQQEGFNLKEFE